MNLPNEAIGTIVGGVVAIFAMIFRAKHKKKITRRKEKEVTTYEDTVSTSTNKKEVH